MDNVFDNFITNDAIDISKAIELPHDVEYKFVEAAANILLTNQKNGKRLYYNNPKAASRSGPASVTLFQCAMSEACVVAVLTHDAIHGNFSEDNLFTIYPGINGCGELYFIYIIPLYSAGLLILEHGFIVGAGLFLRRPIPKLGNSGIHMYIDSWHVPVPESLTAFSIRYSNGSIIQIRSKDPITITITDKKEKTKITKVSEWANSVHNITDILLTNSGESIIDFKPGLRKREMPTLIVQRDWAKSLEFCLFPLIPDDTLLELGLAAALSQFKNIDPLELPETLKKRLRDRQDSYPWYTRLKYGRRRYTPYSVQ
jgi:hypothetical protein